MFAVILGLIFTDTLFIFLLFINFIQDVFIPGLVFIYKLYSNEYEMKKI